MATRTKTTAPRKPAAPATGKAPPKAAPRAKAARATPKTAPKPAAPTAPTAAAAPPATVADDRARKGDLLDAMAERSPMRRADLKVVMELVLEEMGKMLDKGDEVVLPPLGKLIGQETGGPRGRRRHADRQAEAPARGRDGTETPTPERICAPPAGPPCEARAGWLHRADPAGD
jgi:nucleoid DNA-binding protein